MKAVMTARTTTGRWTMKGRCEVMEAGNDSRGLTIWTDLPGMRKRNTAQRWRTAMISPRWYNENNRTSNARAAQAERVARDRERIHRP